MYMYVCICMCVYVCVYVYMYVYVRVYAYMCMYVCVTYWGDCSGEMSYPKREGELSGGNCPGGNCPGGGIVQGGIVLHPRKLVWRLIRTGIATGRNARI